MTRRTHWLDNPLKVAAVWNAWIACAAVASFVVYRLVLAYA